MSRPNAEPLDEGTLRQALRLEAHELPPRLDAAALMAVASAKARPAPPPASWAFTLVAAAVLATFAWAVVVTLAPPLLADALDAGLGLAATIAVPIALSLSVLAGAVQAPVVPLSLVAAIGFAIIFELRQRRERSDVVAP